MTDTEQQSKIAIKKTRVSMKTGLAIYRNAVMNNLTVTHFELTGVPALLRPYELHIEVEGNRDDVNRWGQNLTGKR